MKIVNYQKKVDIVNSWGIAIVFIAVGIVLLF